MLYIDVMTTFIVLKSLSKVLGARATRKDDKQISDVKYQSYEHVYEQENSNLTLK